MDGPSGIKEVLDCKCDQCEAENKKYKFFLQKNKNLLIFLLYIKNIFIIYKK